MDGLDEFTGDEAMLINELKQLLASPFVKICASSRPRNLFEHTFGYEGCEWKVALHELTQNDIMQMARSRLYDDDCFIRLNDTEAQRERFVVTITDKADGVFLWAVLVIREILREAQQGGTMDELQDRLEALPTELTGSEGLFQRIVERSDLRYRKYMARHLLLIVHAGDQGLFWEDIYFVYEEENDPDFMARPCLRLDDKYRLPHDQKIPEGSTQTWEGNDGGLQSSCRGFFVECYNGTSGTHSNEQACRIHQSLLVEDTRQRVRKWCPEFMDASDMTWPHLMHRSVAEYVRLPEVQRQMTAYAGPDFDPWLTLCRLRFAHARVSRVTPGKRAPFYFELAFLR